MRCVVGGVVSRFSLAVVMTFLPMAGFAADGNCARPAERAALELRVLQSELMVAALTCDYQQGYNAFVTRFKPALAQQGKVLKSYFVRVKGKAATSSLDRFVTQLANDASKVSRNMGQSFCATAMEAFQTLSALPVDSLVEYATHWPRASSHGQRVCTAVESTMAATVTDTEETIAVAVSQIDPNLIDAASADYDERWRWPY